MSMIIYESGYVKIFTEDSFEKVFRSKQAMYFHFRDMDQIESDGYSVRRSASGDYLVFTGKRITEEEFLKIVKKFKIDNL